MTFIKNRGTISYLSLTDCTAAGDTLIDNEGIITQQIIRPLS